MKTYFLISDFADINTSNILENKYITKTVININFLINTYKHEYRFHMF